MIPSHKAHKAHAPSGNFYAQKLFRDLPGNLKLTVSCTRKDRTAEPQAHASRKHETRDASRVRCHKEMLLLTYHRRQQEDSAGTVVLADSTYIASRNLVLFRLTLTHYESGRPGVIFSAARANVGQSHDAAAVIRSLGHSVYQSRFLLFTAANCSAGQRSTAAQTECSRSPSAHPTVRHFVR